MEIEIARAVKALVPKGGVAFDVGAFFGYYSLAFARHGASRVLAFEPGPERFALLGETLARNPSLGRRIRPLATWLGTSSSGSSIDQVVKNDASCAPALIKIDVDGPEVDILQGAEETLASFKPRMVIETHGFELEVACLQILIDHGYVYRIVNAQRVWPELRPIEVNRWIIATHRTDDEVIDVVLRKRVRGAKT